MIARMLSDGNDHTMLACANDIYHSRQDYSHLSTFKYKQKKNPVKFLRTFFDTFYKIMKTYA